MGSALFSPKSGNKAVHSDGEGRQERNRYTQSGFQVGIQATEVGREGTG